MRDSVRLLAVFSFRYHPDYCISQDNPLREWVLENRDEFLAELLRWEGRGDHRAYDICPGCSTQRAEYRCRLCMTGGEMVCSACIVEHHKRTPLHVVEFWNGKSFQRQTLKDLGLRIQLGHWYQRDRACPVPEPAPGDAFVIVDNNGVHEVGLDFCGCGGGGSHTRQLLRAGLFPATVQAPRTAATFAVLRRFHLLSFESKCSAYEFFHSLARETDNTGLLPPKDRYHEFLRMTREWANLKMLMRAARGNAASGIAGTSAGECALLCPACPQPGKNLPPGWENAPEEMQFLYALFLAMDANFRLKRKDVSSEEADPGLGPGWAFFCEVTAYMQHLADNWHMKQERSTCVAHDAVDKPDREARGTAASGIGAVDCARHDMKRPSAVGDLQYGERYINMDYMFFLSIAGTELVRLYVSYDIACQWHKNIWIRMQQYKPELQFKADGKFMTFLVPKFHLPAHIEACNLQFSFNLTRDVGQTDGEAPERGWANANRLATSTKEKGPGARRDALDDHFNDVNHKKIVALGRTMLKKVEDAVPAMEEMQAALIEMEASLSPEALGEEAGPIAEWTAMAEAWEKDASKPNPFETLRKDQHLAKVRQELAEEAAARQVAGRESAGEVRDDMHITEMIAMGLQLEDQQRTLRFDVLATGLHPTSDQTRTMVERSSKLRRKILAWIDIQRGFFPMVDRIRTLEDDARARAAKTQPIAGVRVYEMSLWLPSAMMKQAGLSRELPPLLKDSVQHEYRLRVGQANEALHEIRGQLLVRSHLYQMKDAYARGVRENMRSTSKIELCDERIRRMTAQYRNARLALGVLGRVLGREDWLVALKPLLDGDVRGMPHAQFGDPVDKPPSVLSWIWIAQVQDPAPGSSQAMNEAVRIEWAKARARAMRWTEEVDLLEEEMRRIVQFLAWRGDWWEAQIAQRGLGDGPQLEGETAYATRQAALQRSLRDRFLLLWKDLPELISDGRAAVIATREAAAAKGRGASGVTGEGEVHRGRNDVGGGTGAGEGDEEEEMEEEEDEEVDEGASAVPTAALNQIDPLYLNA
ncbi:hypothetical protein B0H15DRAFT_773428 [Mycena belliarum]|uniref:CxC2-like cysteine cluster KDZ transposase-associated domain-containing protein n=1 Tax=Mycena belliarum TaxID=1033014 RepID=A0AAD6UE48_9AGAR|nr:hypothetical protein B0H15DRAFT_773428 [Mycena belliae]